MNPKLPDSVIMTARTLIEQSDKSQFLIGDFLVEIVDELVPSYEQAGVKHARAWMIRSLAASIRVDESTLRDRECVARFFPQDVRQKYSILTYSQFRAIKSAGDRWEEVAEWAVNTLAPTFEIRNHVKGIVEKEPRWKYKWNRAIELIEEVVADDEADTRIRLCAEDILKLIESEGGL